RIRAQRQHQSVGNPCVRTWRAPGRVEEKKRLLPKRGGSEIAGLSSNVAGMGAKPGASTRSAITNPSSDDSGLARSIISALGIRASPVDIRESRISTRLRPNYVVLT